MEEYYWNSYTDKNKIDSFKNKMLIQFTNEPSYELIQSLRCSDSSTKDRNEQLLVDLRNIQKYASQTIQTLNFSFASFVEKCFLVNATDVPYVYKHIQDTINIIDQSELSDKYFNNLYENQYSQLKIMENIFRAIAEGMTSLRGGDANLALNDPDLIKQPDLEKPLSKLLLLSNLVSGNFCMLFRSYPKHFI